LQFSILVSTSNRVSRLFFSGLNEVKIEKNAKHIFFKGEKVAAFRLRSPPAEEAKLMNLETLM
jgi:hypothetical protein